MSNIRVDLNYPIKDGTEVVFRSPVDCSQVTGLIVYYPGEDGNTTSKEFAFADAHGNNVGDIDHLFAENVAVKVILDDTTSMAFVQNADTNAYLEAKFDTKVGIEKQTFTEEEQAQARANIGAQGFEWVRMKGDGDYLTIVAGKKDLANGIPVIFSPMWSKKAILRNIAPGTEDTDAVNKAQMEAYVAENSGGGGDGSVELDTTLTQAGKAADAKAVGDRIDGLNDSIGSIESALDRIIEMQNSLIGGES